MGGRGGGSSSSALGQAQKKAAAAGNDTGFDTGDQELNELLDVFYDTPGYRIGMFNGQSIINYEPNPDLKRDSDDPITFRDMREGLSRKYGWGREKQDREFMRLYRAHQINIYPFSKQLSLTQPMRDAAMNFGGERKDGFQLNEARRYKRSR